MERHFLVGPSSTNPLAEMRLSSRRELVAGLKVERDRGLAADSKDAAADGPLPTPSATGNCHAWENEPQASGSMAAASASRMKPPCNCWGAVYAPGSLSLALKLGSRAVSG